MSNQATTLPVLSVEQRTELLRAGAAAVAEQVALAMPDVLGTALQELSSKRDADAGVLAARRFLTARKDELRQGSIARLRQEQDQALGRLLRRDKPVKSATRITADSLSLVDDDAGSQTEVAAKAARRIRGALQGGSSDLQLVLQYLSSREHIRADDDPFAPEACVTSLLDVARELGLEQNGWEALLGAVERPIAEALARGQAALTERFRSSRLEAGEIRREMAARQPGGRAGPPGAPAGSAAQRLGWMDEAPRVNGISPGGGGSADAGVAAGGGGGGGGGGAGAGGAAGGAAGMALPPVEETRASVESFLARLSGDVQRLSAPALMAVAAGAPSADLLDAVNQMQRLGARAAQQMAETAAALPAGFSGASAPALPAGLAGGVAGDVAAGLPVGLQAALPAAATGIVNETLREELIAKSTRTVDKLTIEIVGMVFEHVLEDGQVPAEIKAVLSRLQFPVLKVALTDADFFASSAHPARRLIDRLASTAAGWEPYGDENLSYKSEVERIVLQVLERFDKDVDIFEQLLGEFESFLGELPVRESDPIVRAKAALEDAETREVLVINTTIQVRRAFENVELEPYLREFLVGPWVQALVSASLRDEQTPGFSKAFKQVIHDVVWSVQPKVSADERKRLVSLIPEMTRVLRDGMAMLKMPESDQQAFLKQLMASHAIAVRPVDQATYIKSKVVTGDLRQKLDDMQLAGSGAVAAPAAEVRISASAVRQAAENRAAQMIVAEPLANVAPLSFEQDAEFEAMIAGWQRGSWFSLSDGKQAVNVRLRWISPLRTLFMFSGGEDKTARVLSPETIKSYLKQGWLKPLEAEPLMKRAVDQVVGDLERSPKRIEQLARKFSDTAMAEPA